MLNCKDRDFLVDLIFVGVQPPTSALRWPNVSSKTKPIQLSHVSNNKKFTSHMCPTAKSQFSHVSNKKSDAMIVVVESLPPVTETLDQLLLLSLQLGHLLRTLSAIEV